MYRSTLLKRFVKKRVQMDEMRRAFTLIELLVTLAIIAILVGITYPVILASKAKGRESACIQYLKQIGAALQFYRGDYDDKMPERLSHLFPTYVNEPNVFHCPSDPKAGKYAGTDRLEGTRFLPTGVSYTWVPMWHAAIEWGWWNPWPNRGTGKWGDLTPVSECHWHWAKTFNEVWVQDKIKGVHGQAFLLTAGASLFRWPASNPLQNFDPEN